MKRFLRDNGLGLGFALIFLLSLVGQAFSGNSLLNDQRLTDGGDPIGLWQYVTSLECAVDVAENWQSEFLAIGSMAVLSVYLRQRGSPESTPVGSPHDVTDEAG